MVLGMPVNPQEVKVWMLFQKVDFLFRVSLQKEVF